MQVETRGCGLRATATQTAENVWSAARTRMFVDSCESVFGHYQPPPRLWSQLLDIPTFPYLPQPTTHCASISKMLIQETHHDVPTKAGGKEGSMSTAWWPLLNTGQLQLIMSRDLSLPSYDSKLSSRVCSALYSTVEVRFKAEAFYHV